MPDWKSIVLEHGPMAYETAWRILGHIADTEDVVQDALLSAFTLHQKSPVQNWGGLLRHLSAQRAIDRLRKNRRLFSEAMPADTQDRLHHGPESVAIAHELADQLRLAVSQLPDRESSVFSLRYFGEMSNDQIATTLEISLDAVGVALHKARKRLKYLLHVKDAEASINSELDSLKRE